MISTIQVFSLFADIHHVHVEFIRFVVSLGSFFRISKEHCGKLSAYRCLVFSIKNLCTAVSVVTHYACITFPLYIPTCFEGPN